MHVFLRAEQSAILSGMCSSSCCCSQAASALPDDSDRYAKMPARLQEKLMGFQREGIKFALKRGGRLLVGDEMGLGKTVQAIGIMACYRDEWPCVIITPSSLRGVCFPPQPECTLHSFSQHAQPVSMPSDLQQAQGTALHGVCRMCLQHAVNELCENRHMSLSNLLVLCVHDAEINCERHV